ncbi:hypothetical protein SAMN02927903_00766 [Flavobacterium caeni]|uniref:Uncharacterized protein n=1 Tax=Flavobacterium caeni TaxID=490189 RepID=A0A1G5D6N3_9FLAO|nr:hypothetical protein SAMN02927903_00766 [Flavobacterium caeni]
MAKRISTAIAHAGVNQQFIIHHSSFVIRHSSFDIRHSSFIIRHSSFDIQNHFPENTAVKSCDFPVFKSMISNRRNALKLPMSLSLLIKIEPIKIT